ncbi:MAG: hypothetical protein ACRDTJ_26555, partial [Pseudonocardiaceae bacterium]
MTTVSVSVCRVVVSAAGQVGSALAAHLRSPRRYPRHWRSRQSPGRARTGRAWSSPSPRRDPRGLLMAKSAIDGVAPLHSVRVRERLMPLAAVLEARPGRGHRELARMARQVATLRPAWFRACRAGRSRPGGASPPARRDGVTRCRARARRGDPA